MIAARSAMVEELARLLRAFIPSQMGRYAALVAAGKDTPDLHAATLRQCRQLQRILTAHLADTALLAATTARYPEITAIAMTALQTSVANIETAVSAVVAANASGAVHGMGALVTTSLGAAATSAISTLRTVLAAEVG